MAKLLVVRKLPVACGGHTFSVSIPGVYAGFVDQIPFGAAFSKGLTFRMGQTHVQRYLQPLLEHIQKGDIDPTFVITHRLQPEQAPYGYEVFANKRDDCIKIVMTP